MFTISLKDLKIIIPIIIAIIGAVFSAGMFMQSKFICVDAIRDATVACNDDLKEKNGELKIAEKYISYLEADSNFNKNQTYKNQQLSNDKKIQLQTHMQKYNVKSFVEKYSQLKQIQTETVIDMRIK